MYIGARDEAKARAAIEDLHSTTGKEAHFLKVDLADLKSVKSAAEQFTRYKILLLIPQQDFSPGISFRQETELHVLYNNAFVELLMISL